MMTYLRKGTSVEPHWTFPLTSFIRRHCSDLLLRWSLLRYYRCLHLLRCQIGLLHHS